MNETLQILDEVNRNKILLYIQNDKYCFLILNYIPDAGKMEQMSLTLIICFVSCSEEKVEIKENFLSFVENVNSTGQILYDIITKMLEMRNIPIENM